MTAVVQMCAARRKTIGPSGVQLIGHWNCLAPNTLFTAPDESTPASEGSPVGRWRDLIADHHLDILAPYGGFTYQGAGVNGKTSIFANASRLITDNLPLAGATVAEVWLVVKMTDFGTSMVAEVGSLANPGTMAVFYGADFFTGMRCLGSGNAGVAEARKAHPTATDAVVRAVVDFSKPADQATVYVNGVAGATYENFINAGPFISGKLSIGTRPDGTASCNGYYGEVRVYKGGLTDLQAAAVLLDLQTAWEF